jgi:hypothetical protein
VSFQDLATVEVTKFRDEKRMDSVEYRVQFGESRGVIFTFVCCIMFSGYPEVSLNLVHVVILS